MHGCALTVAFRLSVLLAMQPDVASRLAAYRLLAATCAVPSIDGWGMRKVWGHPGAASYLLDR